MVGTPEWVDGWVPEWGVGVEPVQMLETVLCSQAGAYHRLSPCEYDAALCGSVHAQAVQMRKWEPHPDRIPGGELARGA